MVILACLSQCAQPTTLRQLGRVIEAMLAISGRVTMKGLSRWSGKGGSYRTIQRLFNTPLNWLQLNWLLIRHHVWDDDEVALMSGDHVVVTKSGKITHGLDRFFSSLYGKAVPGLCFSPRWSSWRSWPHWCHRRGCTRCDMAAVGPRIASYAMRSPQPLASRGSSR
jgi:hypothetical protein